MTQNENSWSSLLFKAGLVGACAIAAPFAFSAGLSAIGFTTAGIAAGSIAAWIMSLSGGAVASGSVCAVSQSIGAAGLGFAGTTIASTAGAAAAVGGLRGRKLFSLKTWLIIYCYVVVAVASAYLCEYLIEINY